MNKSIFSATTHSIKVTVVPSYLENESRPHEDYYVWAYHIQLENYGNVTVQLLNRYWKIIDSKGFIQEVRGPGVIGKQPVLHPGETFNYSSGTHLHTSSGMMMGYYEMVSRNNGEHFLITVPAFSLDSPHEEAMMN